MGVSKLIPLFQKNFPVPLDKWMILLYIRTRIILNLVMRECDTAI